MSYGLEIKDRYGNITLSTEYPQLRIISQGTARTWALVDSWAPSETVDKIAVSSNELLFVKLPDFTDRYAWMVSEQSLPNHLTGNQKGIMLGYAGDILYADYFITSNYEGVAPSSSGYGLETYDSAGNVLFNSNQLHPNIIGNFNIPGSALHLHSALSTYEYSIPDEYKYSELYVCINNMGPVCFFKESPDYVMCMTLGVLSVIEGGVRKLKFSEQSYITDRDSEWNGHYIYNSQRSVIVAVLD